MSRSKSTVPQPPRQSDATLPLYVAYYLMLALLLLGRLFPEIRIWGLNWFAYWPDWISYGVLALAGIAPLLIGRMAPRLLAEAPPGAGPDSARTFWGVATIGCALPAATFFLFPSRTYFLGDGYQLLQRLADHVPPVKSWDMVTSKLHYTLYDLIGGRTDDQALLTFQLISWCAGILVLAITAIAARLLFERNRERWLFLFGVVSSGFMLLYFGYVEHYALFDAVILSFALLGMLALEGKVNRYWLLLPLVLAPILHIFGVLLIPAAAYLLLRETNTGSRFRRISFRTKLLVLILGLLVGGLIYYFFYSRFLFFRFAIIPLFADQFAADGETLFAPRRLLDLGNLLLLLLPGLPLLILAGATSLSETTAKNPAVRFLIILTLSVLGATFIFNPKLGLPRDWDLFAFCGVPLALLAYYLTLRCQVPTRLRVIAVSLSILLGLILLGPRVASQHTPAVASTHLENYLNLDRVKSKNAWSVLMEYYRSVGNETRVDELVKQFDRVYPEVGYNQNSSRLINDGKFRDATGWARRAATANPLFADAWSNLGVCYLDAGYLDSAQIVLQVADGLNPYSPFILNNLGTAYFRADRMADAVDVLHRVLELDSTLINAHINLTAAFHGLGQEDSSFAHLSRLETQPEIGPQFFQRFGELYIERGRFDLASGAYRFALGQGMDSAYYRNQQARFPQLDR